MTWTEVVDSAIKIGLGALIAAVATYLHARSKHRQDLRTNQITREFELLKSVADSIEKFTKAAIKYWAGACDYLSSARGGRDPGEGKTARAKEADRILQDNFLELRHSEAMLALLGHDEASRSAESYGELLVTFRKRVLSGEDMPESEIHEWRANILRARAEVFRHLNACYRGLGP